MLAPRAHCSLGGGTAAHPLPRSRPHRISLPAEEGNGGIAAGGAIMVGLIIAALASQNNGQSAGKEGGDHAHGHSEKKE